jgi:5-methylcytosine-specific restriction endonuclease McrA
MTFRATVSYLNSDGDAIVRQDDVPREDFPDSSDTSYLWLGPADVEAGDTVELKHIEGRFAKVTQDMNKPENYDGLFSYIVWNKKMPDKLQKSREEIRSIVSDSDRAEFEVEIGVKQSEKPRFGGDFIETSKSSATPKEYDLQPGQELKAEIDRISSSGNGIITHPNGHLNIGPISEDSVGKEVKIRGVSPGFARCLTDEVKEENYESRFNEMAQISDSDTDTSSDTATSEADTTANSSIKRNGNRESSDSTDIERLRREAQQDSVQQVSESASTTQSKPQYNRSRKVKEYVKARADGECEGCKKPAPFTSTTGEPYLHAHHIHELSEGGSDTPDTVVALCPNCHYRVHHGKDGTEYNQRLLEKVKEKES